MSQALAAAKTAYNVDIAETPGLLDEAYRLRFQVYCRERQFEESSEEPETRGREMDAYDSHAPHVVLRQRGSGMVVGTARLVLPTHGLESLPVGALCAPELMRHLPTRGTAEVSRFAISKERRAMSEDAAGLMRLALVRGLVRLSAEWGMTHWCAVMERSLLRLLRSSAIWFVPMGPTVEHHGIRQPSFINIDDMLARIASELPALCDYLTCDGLYWRVPGRVPVPELRGPDHRRVLEPMRMAA